MTPRGSGRHPVLLGTAILLFAIGCALAYLSLSEWPGWPAGPGPTLLITDSDYLDLTLARILAFGLLALTPLLAIAVRRRPGLTS
jgi:Sec-independent protein secretion pathway component TatC